MIVSGVIETRAGMRDSFLPRSREAMVAARATTGCHAFVVAADPIEDDRVVVYEEWDSEDAMLAFRQDGPSDDLRALIASADVKRYSVSQSGPA